MSEINNLARQAFNTAITRGKTSKDKVEFNKTII